MSGERQTTGSGLLNVACDHPYNDRMGGWVEIGSRHLGREVDATGTSVGDGSGGSWYRRREGVGLWALMIEVKRNKSSCLHRSSRIFSTTDSTSQNQSSQP